MDCGPFARGMFLFKRNVSAFDFLSLDVTFRKAQMSQKMMRARIGAQGFTVLALMLGVGISASKTYLN